MTTTVMIAVRGNKEVAIETPRGRMVLPPGRWVGDIPIHGDQALKISETGPFVDPGPGARFEELQVIDSAGVGDAGDLLRAPAASGPATD